MSISPRKPPGLPALPGLVLILILALTFSAVSTAAFAKADKPGCKDHPLFPTRMPGYVIADCKTTEFDGDEFLVTKGPKHREEGKFTLIGYAIEDRSQEPSPPVASNDGLEVRGKIGGWSW